MNDKAKSAAGDPVATLSAELEGCRRAMDYCLELALRDEPIPEDYPRPPGNEARDIHDRFAIMQMAIELMKASGGLAEAIAKLKGEMRQSITVDKYNHGPAGAHAPQTLSTQKLRERRENARAIQHEGEGGVPETEKRMGG